MQGIIQQAKPSKSGKTLSVQVGGQWYTTKHGELQNMVGQEITFQSSTQQFPDGGSCTWLNDYTVAGQAGNAADAAFNAAHAQFDERNPPPQDWGVNYDQQTAAVNPPPQSPLPAGIDKEASIIAQALTKSIQHQTAEQAWNAYHYLYEQVRKSHP